MSLRVDEKGKDRGVAPPDRRFVPVLIPANELSLGVYGCRISNNGESGIGGSSGNLGRSGFI